MKKILIVVATHHEIAGLEKKLTASRREIRNIINPFYEFDFLVTGVGSVNTAFMLCKTFNSKVPDLAINIGIAGAFDSNLSLTEVVEVISDQYGDLGVETKDGKFLDIIDMHLGSRKDVFFKSNSKIPEYLMFKNTKLKRVLGMTVNKVHGCEESIQSIRTKYPDVQIESMEGAAFFYACNQFCIPCMQIRSISNYVEPRNKSNWRIDEAIESLHDTLSSLLT